MEVLLGTIDGRSAALPYGVLSDRVKLAREIAARTKPRFSATTERTKDLKALAREIADRTPLRFIEIPRGRGGGKVHYTEEQLAVMRGGLTVEDYCQNLIRAVVDSEPTGD